MQFYKAGKNPADIKNIFISHYDSDHILGIIPLFRVLGHSKDTKRTLICSPEVKAAIDSLFTYTANKHYKRLMPLLDLVLLHDSMKYKNNEWNFTFFDKKSTKTPEFGCTIQFPDNTKLSFLGDEPLHDHEINIVQNSDVLVHEAFCLEKDQEKFEPHPKNHSTVKEAAINAAKIHAKKLVLFHMEDDSLQERKEIYSEEAKKYFNGEIFVPIDLDTLTF